MTIPGPWASRWLLQPAAGEVLAGAGRGEGGKEGGRRPAGQPLTCGRWERDGPGRRHLCRTRGAGTWGRGTGNCRGVAWRGVGYQEKNKKTVIPERGAALSALSVKNKLQSVRAGLAASFPLALLW